LLVPVLVISSNTPSSPSSTPASLGFLATWAHHITQQQQQQQALCTPKATPP
jgi:hypothetical protein